MCAWGAVYAAVLASFAGCQIDRVLDPPGRPVDLYVARISITGFDVKQDEAADAAMIIDKRLPASLERALVGRGYRIERTEGVTEEQNKLIENAASLLAKGAPLPSSQIHREVDRLWPDRPVIIAIPAMVRVDTTDEERAVAAITCLSILAGAPAAPTPIKNVAMHIVLIFSTKNPAYPNILNRDWRWIVEIPDALGSHGFLEFAEERGRSLPRTRQY